MIVVFPAPVCPTIATVSPGSMTKLTSRSTQSSFVGTGVSLVRAERNSALSAGTVGRLGDRRRGDFDRSVEQFEDALARGHGGLQNVVFLAEILNRPEE